MYGLRITTCKVVNPKTKQKAKAKKTFISFKTTFVQKLMVMLWWIMAVCSNNLLHIKHFLAHSSHSIPFNNQYTVLIICCLITHQRTLYSHFRIADSAVGDFDIRMPPQLRCVNELRGSAAVSAIVVIVNISSTKQCFGARVNNWTLVVCVARRDNHWWFKLLTQFRANTISTGAQPRRVVVRVVCHFALHEWGACDVQRMSTIYFNKTTTRITHITSHHR